VQYARFGHTEHPGGVHVGIPCVSRLEKMCYDETSSRGHAIVSQCTHSSETDDWVSDMGARTAAKKHWLGENILQVTLQ
jgi:hypothetical protein